jgi:hypothetical protein
VIDALLLSVRNAIRSAGFGYSQTTCEIGVDPGRPQPRCGEVFITVWEGASTSTNDNCLMEYFAWNLTLTQRVQQPLDRIGDMLLTRELAQKRTPGRPSFNARARQLATFLHMNWAVLGDANTILVNLAEDGNSVYGFCEPARYRGMETPTLVGGEWFSADPEAQEVGLKADLRFEDCRRMQAIGTYE